MLVYLDIIGRIARSTYVDAVYCYRPSSLVVCRSVTSEPCKTAEPIEMPFGLRTRVGPGNHVLDGVQIPPPLKGAILGKEECRDFLP